ncbi:MAG: c-type cytochrome biogenesis protein CcsB [Aquiluna sp.]|nr:c-type cytochrome biogenesis protein CcsB [Aquiluna sp.]MCF8545535.1 c-type cytochrome biogenesis protein CcsB [Aquiluna sp.]
MNQVVLNEPLSQISLLFVSGAMAFIAIALVVFSFQLAKLSSDQSVDSSKLSNLEKLGFWALGLGTLVLTVGVVMRGIAAGRVPWANMYEFSISAALLILMVYLTALKIKDIRYIATFISGFVLVILFAAVSIFYVEVKTLMPALDSYWLVIHVVVAILASSFFAIAAGFHIAYLVKNSGFGKKVMNLFPDLDQLERLAYRFNIVGFVLWSFTLIAGAIWAERAWHRYWGWDTKEVWTFIIWVLYAGYLHAMATRGWRGSKAAWLGVIAFSAVIFNFTIVNLFFKGLHVYSGL